MGEEEGCKNKKSNVISLGRKLKFHLLVYITDIDIDLKRGWKLRKALLDIQEEWLSKKNMHSLLNKL